MLSVARHLLALRRLSFKE